MTDASWIAVVSPIVIAVTGAGGIGGILLTTRASRRAADQTNSVAQAQLSSADWKEFTTQLRGELRDMQERQKDQDNRLTTAENRIRDLERQVEEKERAFTAAVRYIRLLLQLIAAHLPNTQLPAVPPEIANDII